MNKNNKIVAELLKSSGLKQIEFAERIGVSRSHLSMIIADTGNASDQLTELAQLKFAFKGEKESNTESVSINNAEMETEKMYKLKYDLLMEKYVEKSELVIELQQQLLFSAGEDAKKPEGFPKKRQG